MFFHASKKFYVLNFIFFILINTGNLSILTGFPWTIQNRNRLTLLQVRWRSRSLWPAASRSALVTETFFSKFSKNRKLFFIVLESIKKVMIIMMKNIECLVDVSLKNFWPIRLKQNDEVANWLTTWRQHNLYTILAFSRILGQNGLWLVEN